MNKNITTKFYTSFWNDISCRNLFLQHKGELLQHNNFDLGIAKKQYYSSRFIISNSLERKELNKKLALRIENKGIDLYAQIQQSVKKYFEEGVVENYVEKRFGNLIEKVTEEIAEGSWWQFLLKIVGSIGSEKSVIKLLKEYEVIPKNITSYKRLEVYLFDEVKKEMSVFLKNNDLKELFFSIDDVSKYYDIMLRDDLLKADKHFVDILYDTEGFKNRYELFDNLYEIGVFIGAKYKSYYECVVCPQDTFSGMITTNIQPSNAKKIKCPSCGKPLYYMIPYMIHEDIYVSIIQPDGILLAALEFLLSKHEIAYKTNLRFGNDIETDLCLVDKEERILEIIEVKMFKTRQNKETKVGNLKQSVIQVRKMVEKLKLLDENFQHINYVIVSNYSEPDIYTEVYKECKEDIQKYKISIMGVEELLNNVNKR